MPATGDAGRTIEVQEPRSSRWLRASPASGEVEPDENLLDAAHREFFEETGHTLAGPAIPLAPVLQMAGRLVHVSAIEADLDPSTIRSNSFPLEWPPRSGQVRQFPEVDRAAWFEITHAQAKSTKDRSLCSTK